MSRTHRRPSGVHRKFPLFVVVRARERKTKRGRKTKVVEKDALLSGRQARRAAHLPQCTHRNVQLRMVLKANRYRRTQVKTTRPTLTRRNHLTSSQKQNTQRVQDEDGTQTNLHNWTKHDLRERY